MDDVRREIARLSVVEIADAVAGGAGGLRGRVVRSAVSLLARRPSARLGSVLALFDRAIGEVGLARAARQSLEDLGARLDVDGVCPASGAALVVLNHPGAYDALAAMAALGRDDLGIVAADRPFLRTMPRLREHLVFVPDGPAGGASGRARGLRRALDWLGLGRALLHFGAGAIEPDARFAPPRAAVLEPFRDGTGLLVRRALGLSAAVVPCFVAGVHSPRAKRLFVVRWAERRGVTTIAPLIQATLPGFRDVRVSVRIGSPLREAELERARTDHDRAELTREAVGGLRR